MGRCQRLTLTEGSRAMALLVLMTPPSRITATPPHLNGEEAWGRLLDSFCAVRAPALDYKRCRPPAPSLRCGRLFKFRHDLFAQQPKRGHDLLVRDAAAGVELGQDAVEAEGVLELSK